MVMLALGAAAEEGNTIIIGCDMYAPYTYKNGTGEFVGVDVDFATEAFGRLGYAVQFREIVWENKQSYLDSGEIDCLWSCFTMSGREDEYTWAGPYLYSRQVAMVRADSDYTELSQLAGEARGGAGFQHGGKDAAAPRKPERARDEAGALFLHPR